MSETITFHGGHHAWYSPNQEPTVLSIGGWQQEGWTVEEDDGRFEVYYHTHERMRFGADGSLSLGRSEGYWFNTREWAELCAKRLNSLDRAFGRGPEFRLDSSGNFGIGVSPSSWGDRVMFEIRATSEHVLLQIDNGGTVTKFDAPAFLAAWWRGTRAYRMWRVLMWGEKA